MYNQRSGWNVVLAIFGLGILGITLFYSNYLANKLKESEEKNKEIYFGAIDDLANKPDMNADIGLQLAIREKFALPTIIDQNGDYEGANWGENRDNDQEFLSKKVEEFLKEGKEPLDYSAADAQIYIFNSPLVQLIRLYPLVQVLLVGLFIALGYYVFNASRSAEQNRVWAGMVRRLLIS